jgi:2-polyprenyl-3-methyl-5-hydroxy-6-metoxy-1,4-benzoquinol methylase
MNNYSIWEKISEKYSDELITSTNDIHFGVGIPGNKKLNLIPLTLDKLSVIDLGCGSGENLVALSKLGYKITGIDSSETQLELAKELLLENNIDGTLIHDNIFNLKNLNKKFDLILSIGVVHFSSAIKDFFTTCSLLAKKGSILVLSTPHPIDMAIDFTGIDSEDAILFKDYFPTDNLITNAHYWAKFAGHIELASSLEEYIWRPSDVINLMLEQGFNIIGVYEPKADYSSESPCLYKSSKNGFINGICQRVPQYLIYKAIYEK